MDTLLGILKSKFDLSNIVIEKIKNVVMDSRKIEKNSLFFAINNGNTFIDKALEAGAALVIGDNYQGDDPRVIKVENSVKTMQELAREYRKALKIKIIGITGSNGKTTTKDMIHSVLSEKYRCKKTMGNYNNHIGVPYTILQCEDQDEVLVLEMGMSGFGEIDELCSISLPDYGVITNIGDSHLEFLKNRANVCKAKTEMLKYVKPEATILFGDDYYLKDIPGIKVGCGDSNDFQIKNIVDSEKGLTFDINGENYVVALNGRHNAFNAAMAVVIGKLLGMDFKEINRGFEHLFISSMRFEKVEVGDIIYINDAYNASPISMGYSLETFGNLYNDRFKIAALGDMLELGEQEIKYHEDVIRKALEMKIDRIFLYGERMKKALESMALEFTDSDSVKRVTHFKTKDEIKEAIRKIDGAKAILLKGSRGMKMEEIIEK